AKVRSAHDAAPSQAVNTAKVNTVSVNAPMAGNIWKVLVTEGQQVEKDEVLLLLEAMKMETEIRAAQAGTVQGIAVKAGETVAVGDRLMNLI
ncbi:biotin/lipoyl-containing protein, partial [Testudinibacter sp. TR-2022]